MPKQPQPEEAEGLESQKRVTFVEPQEHNNNKTIGDHTRITTTTTMSSTVATTTGKDPERSDGGNINNPTSSYFEMEEDDIDRGWVSWLIPAIVVVNIVVFIVVMYVNNCPKQHGRGGRCMARFLGRFSFQPLIENPLLGPSSGTLTKMGAVEWTKIVQNHQLWRLITSIWLHAGIIHLLINMLSLVFVGIRLEQQFGFLRVGAIYLVSGIGGGILSSLFIHKINVSSVGASGALFGLVGAMLAELITNWALYTNKAAALVTLVFIIAVNLVVGILPHLNNLAHIGGFITGLLLGFVLLLRPHIGYLHSGTAGGRLFWSKYSVYQILLWVVSILLLLIWFIIGMVMLVRGVNGYDHCHWCRYLTCVPTTKWHCTT